MKERLYKQKLKNLISEANWKNIAGRVVDVFLAGLEREASKREDGWKVYFSNLDKVHAAYMRKYSGKCKKEHGFMAGKDWKTKSGMFAQQMKHCMATADMQATRSTLAWLKSKGTKCGNDQQCKIAFMKLKQNLERELLVKKKTVKKMEQSQFFKSDTKMKSKR